MKILRGRKIGVQRLFSSGRHEITINQWEENGSWTAHIAMSIEQAEQLQRHLAREIRRAKRLMGDL